MSGRLFVKVCGITSEEDARLVADAGADALGLVFWPNSPRAVGFEAARRIAAAAPPALVRVGVFVDAGAEAIARAVDEVGLDLVQLHGEERPELLEALPRRAWKALRVGDGLAAADVAPWSRAAGVLLDTRVAGTPGGTGRSFDWRLAAAVRDRIGFLVLAGGLDASNVAEAVAAARPDGVDVSSGVERAPGRKDAAKLRAFVEAARRAS
ncbi:MAG TPA: phosphoribosylanthranilate isomerase [Vicinamibacteria bacterium]|nr:phosphoribosylanthranilate isomerase [Vicinamibacteria bacterium]